MNLTSIGILTLLAILGGWLVPQKLRVQYILAASLLAAFWLQPASPVRNLDFWFPLAAIFLTILTWAMTQSSSKLYQLSSFKQTLFMVALILGIAALRFIEPLCCLTPSTPPPFHYVILALCALFVFLIIFHRFAFTSSKGVWILSFLILLIFLLLKTPSLAAQTSAILRRFTGQDASLASPMDLPWLGFSYLAFRLLHTLRDYQSGKMVSCSLPEFAAYALFFPAFTAGPIDRFQHFTSELNSNRGLHLNPRPLVRLLEYISSQHFSNGLRRLLTGSFKKFVLADSLAVISLSQVSASQVQSSFWMWFMLYAFSLRIYLDFSGYTDIAIGLGHLLGIQLPENFEAPYRKQNLTAFWNSWHITLSQWFRSYFFNPLTRALRTSPRHLPVWLIIFLGQFGTMLLIGLWHGVSWNFAIWGVWHGLGLFLHNRWTDWVRTHPGHFSGVSVNPRLSQFLGWFITFHYVTLGWVWFTLPDFPQSVATLQKLLLFVAGK